MTEDEFWDAFFANPQAVFAQMSAMGTQQALQQWDHSRALQYARDNPDIYANEAQVADIMNRNQLNRNYEGLKLAHRMFKGEARDEEAHYRQQQIEQAEAEQEPPPVTAESAQELLKRYEAKLESIESAEEMNEWCDGQPSGVSEWNFDKDSDPAVAQRLTNYLDDKPFDGQTQKEFAQSLEDEDEPEYEDALEDAGMDADESESTDDSQPE